MSIQPLLEAHWRSTLALLSLGVLLLASASSVVAGGERNFDARIELNRDMDLAPGPQQLQAIDAMRGLLPSLGVTFDRTTGAVRTLQNHTGYLTATDPGVDPAAIATAFVGQNFTLLGLTASDVGDFETETVSSAATGATRMYMQQKHLGLPVYNGQLQINVDQEGRILSVNNAFLPDLDAAVNSSQPTISAEAAVAAAFEHLDNVAGTAGEARLMWLPIRQGDARLVWNFQIETADSLHHYDFTVDAASGQVWTRFDWVAAPAGTSLDPRASIQ